MAEAAGQVTRIDYSAGVLGAVLATSAEVTELLTLEFRDEDDIATTARKRACATALTTALVSRRRVTILHGDEDSAVTAVEFVPSEISPVGPAIHGDFYAVTGAGFADDADIVFESGEESVPVIPDLRRPHLLLVRQLPDTVPPGPAAVSVHGGGRKSASVPVRVETGPPLVARTLYPGRPSSAPFTFVFAATPARETVSGAIIPDGILADRPGFHRLVTDCLIALLTPVEDLLRVDAAEREIRFVAIFDPLQPGDAEVNALVRESPDPETNVPVLIKARTLKLNDFVGQYHEDPDIVFCLTTVAGLNPGGTSATDDVSLAGTPYVMDGIDRTHRHFTDIPGSAAISTDMRRRLQTPLHEFCHSLGAFNDCRCRDLYDDRGRDYTINKKWRTLASDPVPAVFATYEGREYASDPDRAGRGYPAGYRSYHPQLREPGRLNLMDGYRDEAEPKLSRLDLLTYDWIRDRLRAKLRR